MSGSQQADVEKWVGRVTRSLDEEGRAEAARYQRLPVEARWARVAAVCRGIGAKLDARQRERIEREAEADARAFGELMRSIQARSDE